jgi:murein DD-endopeptidase MepM/ murein hydrolase activator NlpD
LVSKRYSIVLADRTTGIVRRFTISLWPTLAAIAAVFALPVLVGLGARWTARSVVAELERSNVALQIENASYREATGQLAGQISSLQAAVDSLGLQAAVDPNAGRAMEKLPALVKSRAMGGALGTASGPVLGAMFAPDLTFGALSDLLNVMASRLDIMRNGVQRRQALAGATPSLWPVAGWLSSSYGNRRDPFTGGADFHPGLDISADYGQPIHATADGTITSAGTSGAYGNLVVIDHGAGLATAYGHNSSIAAGSGSSVSQGQTIAYAGSTGHSTGPHVHFEVRVNGSAVDPLGYLG